MVLSPIIFTVPNLNLSLIFIQASEDTESNITKCSPSYFSICAAEVHAMPRTCKIIIEKATSKVVIISDSMSALFRNNSDTISPRRGSLKTIYMSLMNGKMGAL